ncbi:GGDEF domain-containing protein [Fredinandcohnia sp. 179-A 10B2 NHS]|uniref:GGDEF domain-containing protein n=1 Tax=Fredinandcohnia sp. 179-A 10B2 NHS TaxID=3235176 RepID=UPI00399FAF2A
MRRITSFDDFKRTLYLLMIPIILVAMISYNLMVSDLSGEDFYLLLTRILIAWYSISWFFVYKRILMRMVELTTLVIISLSHIAVVYNVIVNSMASGQEGAIGVSIVWTPLVIVTFFLILRAKWGAIYSLFIFLVVLSFGIISIPKLSNEHLTSLAQFYLSYLVYILVFFVSLYLIRLFTELDIMKKSAYTDALTGISNRYQIDAWLNEMTQVAKDHHLPLGIMFLDIDHFKAINDTYGHNVGDYVLKEMSLLIANNLPEGYYFGRWGGEEFIVLTNDSIENVEEFAEQLRVVIEDYEFGVAGKQTVSIGVTGYRTVDTVDTLLTRADKALYESKNRGRNRVSVI